MPMPKPQESIGAVPQDQAMQQNKPGNLKPQDIQGFRQNPRIKQAVEIFLGHPADLTDTTLYPDELLVEIAGMVNKLGPQGAADMARKMIPQDVQEKMRAAASKQSPQGQTAQPMPQKPDETMNQTPRSDVAAVRG